MEQRKRKKRYIILVIIFLLILISSAGVLVLIEAKNPNYGIIKRLDVAKQIIFDRNWLKTYTDYNTIIKEFKVKEAELKNINKEIKTKKDILHDIEYLIDSRFPVLRKKVEVLNNKVKTLDHKFSNHKKK
jgi:t-SNARE complex subunit (syntaxin)